MADNGKQAVLVTGGTGFTGSHLVRRLLGRGHRVRVVDNQRGLFYDELARLGAEMCLGSVTDRALMAELTRGMDVVHHVAAAFRRIDLPDEAYREVNAHGTRVVLEAAQAAGVRKVIYCSTCGVHGNVERPPAAETAPIAPEDFYQQTKYEGEQVAHEFIADGMDVTILRPAAIYGPGDPERWVMLFRQTRRGVFPMFGSGEVTYHPLYIDNLVDAFELAAERPEARGQTYLIADQEYYTLNDLVRIVGEVQGRPVRIVHLPFWPLRAAAAAVEDASTALHRTPPIFRRRVDWFRQNRAFDVSKAQRELGYRSRVKLREGLRRTYEWYREHGYV